MSWHLSHTMTYMIWLTWNGWDEMDDIMKPMRLTWYVFNLHGIIGLTFGTGDMTHMTCHDVTWHDMTWNSMKLHGMTYTAGPSWHKFKNNNAYLAGFDWHDMRYQFKTICNWPTKFAQTVLHCMMWHAVPFLVRTVLTCKQTLIIVSPTMV